MAAQSPSVGYDRQSWPTHSERRARARQALNAVQSALKQSHAIVETLTDSPPTSELAYRLKAIAPAISAQIAAASAGHAAHTASGLIDSSDHVLYGAAKHYFTVPFATVTPASARTAQRQRTRDRDCLWDASVAPGHINGDKIQSDKCLDHLIRYCLVDIYTEEHEDQQDCLADEDPPPPPPDMPELKNVVMCSDLEKFRNQLFAPRGVAPITIVPFMSLPRALQRKCPPPPPLSLLSGSGLSTVLQQSATLINQGCIGQTCGKCNVWVPHTLGYNDWCGHCRDTCGKHADDIEQSVQVDYDSVVVELDGADVSQLSNTADDDSAADSEIGFTMKRYTFRKLKGDEEGCKPTASTLPLFDGPKPVDICSASFAAWATPTIDSVLETHGGCMHIHQLQSTMVDLFFSTCAMPTPSQASHVGHGVFALIPNSYLSREDAMVRLSQQPFLMKRYSFCHTIGSTNGAGAASLLPSCDHDPNGAGVAHDCNQQ